MSASRACTRRRLLWVVVPVLLGGLACNPEFVANLGGDPTNASGGVSGSILIVVNNQTAADVELSMTINRTNAGEATTTGTQTITVPQGYVIFSDDCSVRSITIDSLTVGGADVGLAANTFAPPALRCGSILFVTVQGFTGTFSASAELYN